MCQDEYEELILQDQEDLNMGREEARANGGIHEANS